MNKIKQFLVAMVLVLGVGTFAVSTTTPTMVAAQNKEDICKGIGLVGGSNDCSQPDGVPNVNSTLENAVNLLSVVVGVISVIMIIIGGLKYITSGGDSSKVSSAKDTILYAVIGLVVVAMAQVIVRFVLNEATTV